MLSFTGSIKVMVALEACDMRKGFDGLAALVVGQLGEDVRGGAIYVFSNRRRTRLKLLYWDGSGLWLMSKRLEKGTFSWPEKADGGKVKLRLAPEAFAMLTDGVDLRSGRLRAWYEREQ
jgi:transposase